MKGLRKARSRGPSQSCTGTLEPRRRLRRRLLVLSGSGSGCGSFLSLARLLTYESVVLWTCSPGEAEWDEPFSAWVLLGFSLLT